MAFSRAFLYLLSTFACISIANASSPLPRPVRRVDHPTTVALHIVPRSLPLDPLQARSFPLDSPQLRHDDSLRISLSAFSQAFHLHLRPHDTFLHPSARVKYYKTPPNGGEPYLDRVEHLQRESVKVYYGDVVHADETGRRLVEESAGGIFKPYGTKRPGELGWARIMVHDQGDVQSGRVPQFEGAFSYEGVVHHIVTKETYLRNRLRFDPELLHGPNADLVIFRDSDMVSHEEEEALRTGMPLSAIRPKTTSPLSCAHDRLGYNVDTQSNPVLRFGSGLDHEPRAPWYDPLGLTIPDPWSEEFRNGTAKVIVKRQGDAQGATGGSNFIDRIGQIDGCPKTQKIVYIGVAADCEYVKTNGGTSNATTSILKNFNTVSLLFKSTFNVSLGIIELIVQDGNCPATPPEAFPWNSACGPMTLNERLSTFSAWRGAKGSDGAGLWHLMSGCPTGTEVGVAWLGTLCLSKSGGSPPSVVSGTAVSTGGKSEWQVISHEIGHNFGAIHDCAADCKSTDTCCPLSTATCNANSGFIMSPVSSTKEEAFSRCSLGNICSLMLGTGMDTSCIQDPDPTKRVFSLQMCGNGVVEPGEDCDPGSGLGAGNSTCCDPATCKFRSGALCDPLSSPCCTQACSFAPKTQVCRPSRDAQCDVEETCTGLAATCPGDTTKPNGQSCGKDGLACAAGSCTSATQQCKVLGAALKLTKACPRPDDQHKCQVSCQDPVNPNQCVVLQSQLIDGSPCGFGGTCFAGDCKSGTLLQTALAWYTQNLTISIPVTVVVGIIVLLILYFIISALFRCCCRRRPEAKLPPAIPKAARGRRIGSISGVPPAARNSGGPPMLTQPPMMTGVGANGHSSRTLAPSSVFPPAHPPPYRTGSPGPGGPFRAASPGGYRGTAPNPPQGGLYTRAPSPHAGPFAGRMHNSQASYDSGRPLIDHARSGSYGGYQEGLPRVQFPPPSLVPGGQYPTSGSGWVDESRRNDR